MRFFNDSRPQIPAPLGSSSLEDWPSFLENSPGGTMRPLFRASLLERIAAYSRTPQGLAAGCILWLLFLLALVFASTQLISWVTQPRGSNASSMAASLSGSDLGIWTARRLYCYPLQPCDIWNPFSEEIPSSLRYEIQTEEVMHAT